MHMQTRPEQGNSDGAKRSPRSGCREAAWEGREPSVSARLRGGRWWDPWPAQAPGGRPDRRERRTGSIPRSVLERSKMRGEGTGSLEDQAGVNVTVAKPLGAPCGTHDAGRRRSRRERRGWEDSHRFVVRAESRAKAAGFQVWSDELTWK
jgi:hypothetical protein